MDPATCPDCGAELRRGTDEACVVFTCPRCPWRAVTSNLDVPPYDPLRYRVFATADVRGKLLAVRLGLALGQPARAMLAAAAGRAAIAQDVDACEVQRLAQLLAPAGVGVRIEPPFRRPLPAVGPTR